MIKKCWIVLSILVFISACRHIPESLRVEKGAVLTTFSDTHSDDNSTVGKLARWGGVIAKIENYADNTMLEIVHFQLKSSTRPQQKDQTLGRFKIYQEGFLDPIIFKEGRSVTVLGIIGTKEKGKIGEHEYAYPVLKASYVHLWKEIKEVDARVTNQPLWHSPLLWYQPRSLYYPGIYRPITKSKSSSKSKPESKN
jgi:outer membrane lipoprotein